jgi:hypothetical protein
MASYDIIWTETQFERFFVRYSSGALGSGHSKLRHRRNRRRRPDETAIVTLLSLASVALVVWRC